MTQHLYAAQIGETGELLADDPIWLILIKVVAIFAFLVGHDPVHDQLGAQGRRRGCSSVPARTGSARTAGCSRSPTV